MNKNIQKILPTKKAVYNMYREYKYAYADWTSLMAVVSV
jgi:hypothetical protein